MAKGKKSFVLHTDLIEIVMGNTKHDVEIPEMSDEDSGKLLKWILKYVNDQHPTVPREIVYAVAFVKKQLDAELEAYQNQCEVNAINGAKGGRPKKPKETEKTEPVLEKPKKADTDTDTDTDFILDKLDKLDKHYNDQPSELHVKIDKIKEHLSKHGLDFAFYKSLNYEIAPYYYTMKLNHIDCKDVDTFFNDIKGDTTSEKVFFYTLDKILKSEFKADSFIAYFKSTYEKNYNQYLKEKELRGE